MRRKLKKGDNKKIRNAQKLTVDGVEFRSKLEAFCYNKLKEAGIDTIYEGKSFTVVDGFEFMGEKIRPITIKPDFINEEEGLIIECKGFANEVFPLRWKLFKRFLKDNGLDYDLYLPRNQQQILQMIETIKTKRNGN
jgi:hypothetical protein